MDASSLRHTELPDTSRLFADLLYHRERVARFYDGGARSEHPGERRATMVAALREQNGEDPLLGVLAQPGAVAVVTGQQVGLFGGPLYAVYKALTAVKLARRLSESGTPAVPVFWLATEDHDFAEVNHCWVQDASGQPLRIEHPVTAHDRTPAGGIGVTAPPVEELQRALREYPFGDETTRLAEETYRPGETFGSAFAGLMRRVLGGHRLLYLDPLQPSIRRLAAPLLGQAAARASELTRLVLERNRELTEAGYHAQVHVEEESSFVFLLENGRRTALERRHAESAAARAEQLSPNALLRPVMQDYLLPTAAYVGGPAELAYLAQSQALYRALLGGMAAPVPRYSGTLLDSRATRLMTRFELGLPDFFHGVEALRARIAERLVPPAITGVLGNTQERTSGLLDELGAALTGFDASLARGFQTSRRKILYQLSKTERKVARETLRRDERASRDADYLGNLISPHRHLQERFYSVLPFLAKHGPALIDRVYEAIDLDCPDHRLLPV